MSAIRPRIAAPGRVRQGYDKPLIVDGVRRCLDCGEVSRGQALRCGPCAKTRFRMMEARRQKAGTAVKKAVASKTLKRPSELECVDCGRPAECYDHRDYSKPLDVDPVCRSCNCMRGPAAVKDAA